MVERSPRMVSMKNQRERERDRAVRGSEIRRNGLLTCFTEVLPIRMRMVRRQDKKARPVPMVKVRETMLFGLRNVTIRSFREQKSNVLNDGILVSNRN